MKYPLLIPKKLLYVLALFGAVFTIFTFGLDFTTFGISRDIGRLVTYFALLCSFSTALVLISDVFKNEIPSKYLWTLGFLLSGGIIGLIYLRNRSRYELQ